MCLNDEIFKKNDATDDIGGNYQVLSLYGGQFTLSTPLIKQIFVLSGNTLGVFMTS